MRTFDYAATTAKLLTPETVQLISALHECKGKQALYLRATPDVLDALLEIAKIQSAASSNRIEGISTSDARIKAPMIGTTAPNLRLRARWRRFARPRTRRWTLERSTRCS